MSVAVVIPVLNGERWLREVLSALTDVDEVLVIDSGSTDASLALAREAGARLHELAPGEFGHGRTRNLGVALLPDFELIAFLTQDATPVPGWAAAYRAAFAASPELGAAFGPHLPRPDTSPMIARELTEFFAGDGPRQPWISNVNACYRRSVLLETPFADVPYAEDQAFARDCERPIAFVRDAAVLHAHDYGPAGFARRYFDEYRGLARTTGHVEPLALRGVRSQVAADVRFAGSRRVAARSALHHGSRRVFSALGSRADRLPERVQDAISLEGASKGPDPSRAAPQPPRGPLAYQPILDVARDGVVPLLQPVPGQAEKEKLHIAVVIPAFRRGSGGHSTIYNLLTRLEDRGHTVSTWVHDPPGRMRDEWPAVVRANLREFFRPPSGPVFKGFVNWHGADVALATGWETVHPVLRLDHTRARAYLVQDHEPEFFPTSAQRQWAEDTYDQELHTIAASPWLADVVTARSGRPATYFDLAVDHAVYQPRPVARREDTVVFYARDATERRGVPLGLLALAELHRRRPQLRFVLFGDPMPAPTPFPYEHLGVASPEQLSWAYSEGTVGLSLSLTNYSLIPQEMLACGLPCVELSGHSLESVYGGDGPIELADADPLSLADAVERLLDDPALRAQRAAAGIEFVAPRTWEHATDQVEAGLRQALRRAERHEDDPDAVATLERGHRAMAGASARGVPADADAAGECVATTVLWERLGEAGAEQANGSRDCR